MALITGAAIGVLGGLIGLGGAEFRLPLLITVFGFVALEAVIVNKAISLIVVASALAFRSTTIPIETMLDNGSIVINLLAGSLVGAWFGADLATRLATTTLYRVIAVLLVLIALVLAFAHDPSSPGEPIAHGAALVTLGLVAGFAIGVIAALLGVAGGELLIPTLVLLFGADIKLAGSLSLAISLPTMLVSFARYSRDRSFGVLGAHRAFVLTMAAGSIIGTYVGARLLPIVPETLLVPILAIILAASSIKVCNRAHEPGLHGAFFGQRRCAFKSFDNPRHTHGSIGFSSDTRATEVSSYARGADGPRTFAISQFTVDGRLPAPAA